MAAELEFPVMGTTAHVQVAAGTDRIAGAAAHRARDRLHELEARWSPAVPSSDIARLNAGDGNPVEVAPETLALVERAVEAWWRTRGSFDPVVEPPPAPGCQRIAVDRAAGTVQLPVGVAFDPCGVARGLAADIVVRELMNSRARGARVSVGGDLRVEGDAGDGGGWLVNLEHPLTGRSLSHVRLHNAAVASTWRTHRVWGPPSVSRDMITDRCTDPTSICLAGATVLTGRAWWAEVLATTANRVGPALGAALLTEHQASGFLVEKDGRIRAVGLAERFAAA
jgi:thiamine biosynthesis lipoprotein